MMSFNHTLQTIGVYIYCSRINCKKSTHQKREQYTNSDCQIIDVKWIYVHGAGLAPMHESSLCPPVINMAFGAG